MRGTAPYPHEVIQPTERKPPNPDGPGCGQLRVSGQPSCVKEAGVTTDGQPAHSGPWFSGAGRQGLGRSIWR